MMSRLASRTALLTSIGIGSVWSVTYRPASTSKYAAGTAGNSLMPASSGRRL